MTKIVNLYGGPGTGKSTIAAKAFALLKEGGVNAELVTEYVKQWAWEGRQPVNYDQFYFFGKQTRREYSLFGKVDVIVTDSPIAINAYYAQVYGSPQQAALFRQMLLEYQRMCAEEGHKHEHIFIERVKAYNPAGRYQTEDQAKAIDAELRTFLKQMGLSTITTPGDEFAGAFVAGIGMGMKP